jgi:hypothetical protein
MNAQSIPDIITIIGESYFQPIADLIARLLEKEAPRPVAMGTTGRENGYSAAIVILLVATLESYVARVRFTRRDEIARLKGASSVPDLLKELYPGLNLHDELLEVFLLRNLVAHNHLYHLDVSSGGVAKAEMLGGPLDFGISVNRHYAYLVDQKSRKTKFLSLNANPAAVDRGDAKRAFEVVWKTLWFMHKTSYSDTPIGAGRTIVFRRKRLQFEELRQYL